MFEFKRLSRVVLIGCIVSAFALALWVLALVASQTALPVAALQAGVFTDTLTIIPTISPTATPLPEFNVEKSYEIIGDQNSNRSPDPGDTIRYTITITNSGSYAVSNVEIVDDYDDTLLETPNKISNEGYIREGNVLWQLEMLEVDKTTTVTYDAKVNLTFPTGKTTIKNSVAVNIQGVIYGIGESNLVINFNPSETPSPTSTYTPTATFTLVPTTPVSANQSAGPTSQAISPTAQALLAFGFIIAAVGGLMAFAFLTYKDKEIPATLRDGYILTLIMGVVIILGLAGSVERSAIAGLIGTVAGYVLRGVVEVGKHKDSEAEGGGAGDSKPEEGKPAVG